MKTIKIYCTLGITCLYYLIGANAEILYELKPDELMEKILKDSYKGKYEKRFPTYPNTTEASLKSATKTVSTTPPHVLTPTPIKRRDQNMTLEEYKSRKRYLDLKMMLNYRHGLPNFRSKEDELTVQTRRFNAISASEPNPNVLRESYFSFERPWLIKVEKRRTISLMQQFIYETRYSLPYAQLLRKKYSSDVSYQLGYCFALLKYLKQQQRAIYTTLYTLADMLRTLFAHVKFYEKIVRLDMDMRDLIALISVLFDKRASAAELKTRD